MSSVVCNAGPLIVLTGIGQVGLLRELFGEVLVSCKVRDEVEGLENREQEQDCFANAPRMHVIRLTDLLSTPFWNRSWTKAKRTIASHL